MNNIEEIDSIGFAIFENVYTENEILKLNSVINQGIRFNSENSSFRKTHKLSAIRPFLNEILDYLKIILNKNLKEVIDCNLGSDYFVIKSIYFDKPELSN